MALVYPGTAPIPRYESSLAAFMPALEAGQKARTDANAFDAAATAFGGGAPTKAPSPIERLMSLVTGKPAPEAAQQQTGPYTRPQPPANAVAAIDAAVAPTRSAPPTTPQPGDQIATMGGAGIPQGYIASARAAESGGNDAAANPDSSALGRYQFLESTWNGLAQQYPQLGLTADGRTDPAQQERAMAQFTQDNARALSGSGIPVNPGTLYAAHFLGAGGAQKALSADPSTPMSALVEPAVIQANPQLRGMSAGDFAQWANRKGGNQSGGYQPPMQDVGGGAGKAFDVDPDTMRALLASEATRPLAVSLIQARQETLASQGRFVTEQGDDGAIWQRDTLTGEQRVLREPPTPEKRRIVEGPDGNSYYEDGSRVLPDIDAAPDRLKPPEVETRYNELTGQDEKVTWNATTGAWETFGGQKAPSGPLVTIGGEGQDGALNGALSKAEGETWATYKQAATVSASNAQDFEILGELLTLAPQGPVTGRLADTFKGFSAAGDAVNSIVKRIAPTLRAPGSGATSDIEYDGMLRSLPSLSSQPESNAMVLSLMQAKAQLNMERGRTISAYQNGEINPETGLPVTVAETRRKMDELDSRSIMTPEMKRALLGLGSDGNVGTPPPAIGEEVDGYIFQGGDPSSPTSWTQVN